MSGVLAVDRAYKGFGRVRNEPWHGKAGRALSKLQLLTVNRLKEAQKELEDLYDYPKPKSKAYFVNYQESAGHTYTRVK